jgi:hypothetical protein
MRAKSKGADGYVDSSPLRSEFPTYPQPLLPKEGKEKETVQSHLDVGYPQPAASRTPSAPAAAGRWITHREADKNRKCHSHRQKTNDCLDINDTYCLG